jgi:hypothetical protein
MAAPDCKTAVLVRIWLLPSLHKHCQSLGGLAPGKVYCSIMGLPLRSSRGIKIHETQNIIIKNIYTCSTVGLSYPSVHVE